MLQKTKTLDTITAIEYESLLVSDNKQVILVKEPKSKNEKGWYEHTLLVSFLYPALTAVIILIITKKLNRKRNRVESNKLTEEISQIREETKSIKKSFQPIVIATLQSVQEEIITSKIKALKKLIGLRNNFIYHDQQYFEGDPVLPNHEELLELLFYNYNFQDFEDFKKYRNSFSYLFPDIVLNQLEELYKILSELYEDKKSLEAYDDPDYELPITETGRIENIINLFKNAIAAIRKDCHLDTSFMHEFIEQNK